MRMRRSEFSSYLRCPKSYWYQYVQKTEYDSTPAMHLGTIVHQAIAAVHDADLSTDEAQEVLAQLWEQSPENIRTDAKTVKKYAAAQSAWIPWYVSAVAGQESVGVEAYLQQPVNNNLQINGTLDRVYLDDNGGCVIADAKTGRNKPRYLENDLQLSVYAWLWQQNSGVLPSRVEIWHLPSQTVSSAIRTEESLEAVISDVVEPIANAISLGLFPANSGHPFGCDFCSFRHLCTVGTGCIAEEPEEAAQDEPESER